MKQIIRMVVWSILFLGLSAAWGGPALAEQANPDDWPRQIDIPGYTVIVYQPQPDKLIGDNLTGRMAVSMEPEGSGRPVFGAVWIEAKLRTDRAERTAEITEVKVTRVRFPDNNQDKDRRLTALLEREMPKWSIQLSLDQLTSSLETAEMRAAEAKNLGVAPPKIIFRDRPAVLITIDGRPKLQREQNSSLMRVVNTPFTILMSPTSKTYYLFADKQRWYSAHDVTGPWTAARNVPRDVAARAPKEEENNQGEATAPTVKPGPPPEVVVAFEPTELISTDGQPLYSPISGTDLLYMSNTDSDVLLNIKTQQYFVLLSGRWYQAGSLNGPWRYTKGTDLPKDFARIPKSSDMNAVRYAVPGTDEAKDAVLDAYIPQTAAVNRAKASLTVRYDGAPVFRPIGSTAMSYAINTATPVVRVGPRYYACDQAVWFWADTPYGPWRVASSIPEVIYSIPPDCPIYNVTYVRIYSADPDVVYVGYTPGYTNTYIYNGTIVYGTGYHYPSWYRTWYCPAPATWGFHVHWTPWYGWGFGFSYGYAPFAYGWGDWYWGGWWGPMRHYHYRHGHRRYRPPNRRPHYRDNLYLGRSNRSRVRPGASSGVRRGALTSRPINRRNDVYVDRNGGIHRRTDRGWQQLENNRWRSQPAGNGIVRPGGDRNRRPGGERLLTDRFRANQQQLDRSFQSRERGAERFHQYPMGDRGGWRRR